MFKAELFDQSLGKVYSKNFSLSRDLWFSGYKSALQCREPGFDVLSRNYDPLYLRATQPMPHLESPKSHSERSCKLQGGLLALQPTQPHK